MLTKNSGVFYTTKIKLLKLYSDKFGVYLIGSDMTVNTIENQILVDKYFKKGV